MLCATTGVHGEAYTVLWTPSATEQVAEQVASSAFGFVDTGTISVDVTCVCSGHDCDCVISCLIRSITQDALDYVDVLVVATYTPDVRKKISQRLKFAFTRLFETGF
jgi:hypothetical protein